MAYVRQTNLHEGRKTMRHKAILSSFIALAYLTHGPGLASAESLASLLAQEFDLSGARTTDTQHYLLETRVTLFAPSGAPRQTFTLKLRLEINPARQSGKDGDEYICREFLIKQDDAPYVSVPALKDWAYIFRPDFTGTDTDTPIFGISHTPFEGLKDSNGKPFPVLLAYGAYNSFIDFHAFSNIYAEQTTVGGGMQDLRTIGKKVLHAAAFTEPPVNLGSQIAEGSTFKNGEVTLQFKGLSLVDEAVCALVAYDSGESSFKMRMRPAPNLEIETVGRSHYFGDLYIDLETKWVRKVTMSEFVVSQTKLPGPSQTIDGVTERALIFRLVSPGRFQSDFAATSLFEE